MSADAPAAAAAARVRVTWVDLLKAVAILLVVVQHFNDLTVMRDWEWQPLDVGSSAMRTIRMPAFVFASGLFFGGNFRRPIGFVVVRKVLPMLWLYVVWSVLYVGFRVTVGKAVGDADAPELSQVLHIFEHPQTYLWYVYALALYFLVAWVSSKAPAWVGWLVACAISLPFLANLVTTGMWGWDRILSFYAFFWAATQLMPWLRGLPAPGSGTLWSVAGAGVVWAGVTAVEIKVAHSVNTVVFPLVAAVAVFGCVQAARCLDTCTGRWVDALRWVGQNTLPVYVLHMFVLELLGPLLPHLPRSPAVVVALLLVSVIGAVGASFLLWVPLRRVPGLFQAPWLPAREPVPFPSAAAKGDGSR